MSFLCLISILNSVTSTNNLSSFSLILYLDVLLSEQSDYELKNYIKNRSVKHYMFKNRVYTIYQYEILSLILSALLGFVFIGFFISFIPNIMAYMIASFLLSIVFYLFDVFEFIL